MTRLACRHAFGLRVGQRGSAIESGDRTARNKAVPRDMVIEHRDVASALLVMPAPIEDRAGIRKDVVQREVMPGLARTVDCGGRHAHRSVWRACQPLDLRQHASHEDSGSDRYRMTYEPKYRRSRCSRLSSRQRALRRLAQKELGDTGVHLALRQDGGVACGGD